MNINGLQTRKNSSDLALHYNILQDEISKAICLKRVQIHLYFNKMKTLLNVRFRQ